MVMEPFILECMNHLLLLLIHGNRCAVLVKIKQPGHKKWARLTTTSQFALQKRTSVKPHIVKPQDHKYIPMSNHDLLEWCRYLNIPTN